MSIRRSSRLSQQRPQQPVTKPKKSRTNTKEPDVTKVSTLTKHAVRDLQKADNILQTSKKLSPKKKEPEEEEKPKSKRKPTKKHETYVIYIKKVLKKIEKAQKQQIKIDDDSKNQIHDMLLHFFNKVIEEIRKIQSFKTHKSKSPKSKSKKSKSKKSKSTESKSPKTSNTKKTNDEDDDSTVVFGDEDTDEEVDEETDEDEDTEEETDEEEEEDEEVDGVFTDEETDEDEQTTDGRKKNSGKKNKSAVFKRQTNGMLTTNFIKRCINSILDAKYFKKFESQANIAIEKFKSSKNAKDVRGRSEKAGIIFPIGRIHRYLKNELPTLQISMTAAICMAVFLEFITDRLLNISNERKNKNKRKTIKVIDIKTAVKNHEYFSTIFIYRDIISDVEKEKIKKLQQEQATIKKEKQLKSVEVKKEKLVRDRDEKPYEEKAKKLGITSEQYKKLLKIRNLTMKSKSTDEEREHARKLLSKQLTKYNVNENMFENVSKLSPEKIREDPKITRERIADKVSKK